VQVCNGKSQEGEPLLLALLETLRDVRAGEELTFDYKPSSKSWKGPGKPQGLLECKCGAHNCRWGATNSNLGVDGWWGLCRIMKHVK
jgi:hypothetical protein